MTQPLVPQTYADWKKCITILCGIPLTLDYVDARIAALADASDYETQRFLRTWGPPHLSRVQAWFCEAREELPAMGSP